MTRVPTHRLSPATGATSTHETDEDWRHHAACRDQDPELFFPNGNSGTALLQIEEAKAVCRHCDVMDTCLRWALETGQDAGVWGGLSEDERRAMKRAQDRQRRRVSATVATKPPASRTRPTNDRPICGTQTGHAEHARKRERQCDACRAWKATTTDQPTPTSCGTLPGYRKHTAAGETPCNPCRAAKAADSAKYRQRQRTNAA